MGELPEFVYKRILKDSEDGCCSTFTVDVISAKWLHVYECSNPLYSLLLMGVSNMLLKNHVRRRLLIPRKLHKNSKKQVT